MDVELFPIKTVYLAGPIAGLTHDEARYMWRPDFAQLMPEWIKCSSPMRAKEFLADRGVLTCGPELDHPIATDGGIVTRDHNDVLTCDAMVACFLEAQAPSLGTAIEFGWAHAYNKPIVMVAREDDVHRMHPMMRRIAGYVTEDLDMAAHIVTHLLTPGI